MNRQERRSKNVKSIFQATRYDEAVSEELAYISKSQPHMIFKKFYEYKNNLSDSAYWYILATMWNSYPNLGTDSQWVELFSADRVDRKKTMMKPNELRLWKKLPPKIKLYRESADRAFVYRLKASVQSVQYAIACKSVVTAYFEKRQEIIILKDPTKPYEMDVPKFRDDKTPMEIGHEVHARILGIQGIEK